MKRRGPMVKILIEAEVSKNGEVGPVYVSFTSRVRGLFLKPSSQRPEDCVTPSGRWLIENSFDFEGMKRRQLKDGTHREVGAEK